jgi:p-hydroxybenzoate 3-monooxygenase
MTQLLHRRPHEDEFDDQMHLAQLRYLTSSRAASKSLAENYTGAATGGIAVAKIGP